MQVKRNELVDILRAHEADKTAHRAERSLPPDIDLDRDRILLRQLGIDPNVLAVLLSADDRRVRPTETLAPTLTAPDHVAVSQPSAENSSSIGGPAGPAVPGWRVDEDGDGDDAAATQLVRLEDAHSPSTGRAATAQSLEPDEAPPEVAHTSAGWCPRCQSKFASVDLMLDHLNGEHLESTSLKEPRMPRDGARLTLSTSEIDEALKDIARAFREPAFQRPAPREVARQRRHRISLMTVIGPLLLVIGIVTVIAGEVLGGVALAALGLLVAVVVRAVGRWSADR